MKTNKILIGSFVTVCIAIIIAACYNSTNYTKGITDHTIRMQNSTFLPATSTVPTNSKVTWVNDDNVIHTVTAADGSFNSGDIAEGASYSRTFATTGTIKYYDSHTQSMTGILVVSDSSRAEGY